MLKGMKVLWPEHFDYYSLMVMKETDTESSFNSEMQNEPVNTKDCIFNIAILRYWTDKYGSVEEFMRYMRNRVLIYIGCDPSLGDHADSGDFSAIVVIAYDPERGIFYVLEVDVDRRRPSETIERIIDYAKKYEVIKVGVEVNQFQVLMADDLRRRADEENIRMPMARVTNTSNKRMRIESLQPLFESERIQISRKHYALIEELQYFPKGKHDDALDALEIAIRTATGCTARFGIRSI